MQAKACMLKIMNNQKEIVIFSFTMTGNRLNRCVQEQLSGCGYLCEGYTTARLRDTEGLKTPDMDLKTWVGQRWGKKMFLFIGASGIAVRCIAPWVKDKYTDSAVLVMDEKGEHVIPLLSGHMGGAVEAAKEIERAMHAKAVITTATDVQGRFAVDIFARKNDLEITDRSLVTRISAAVLEDRPIGFYSELPLAEPVPKGLIQCTSMEELSDYAYGIAVVDRARENFACERKENILFLRSRSFRSIVVGIGCRRGTSKHQIKASLEKILKEHGLKLENVSCLASIDLKKEEPGILAFSREHHLPFYTYSARELQKVSGEITGSDFVLKTAGVDNVCERAARYCAPEGKLLQPKRIAGGITLALVEGKLPGILLFGGTTESLELLAFLRTLRAEVTVSVATEYGKEGIAEDEKTKVICGRMDREEMSSFIQEHSIDLVIDATHPFAAEVTRQIMQACERTETEYIRCLREETKTPEEGTDQAVYVSSVKEAVEYLKTVKGRILITTGSKELRRFCEIPDYRARCCARVLSVPDSIMSSAECGFSGKNLIAMQAPFSKEMNIAAIHYADADFFVTKESGDAGGMKEKIQACTETGTTLVVIRRPKETGRSVEEVCKDLREKY